MVIKSAGREVGIHMKIESTQCCSESDSKFKVALKDQFIQHIAKVKG